MPLLEPPQIIARKRAEAALVRLETAIIQRFAPTPTDDGGSTKVWNTIATVSCRISQSHRFRVERQIADRTMAENLSSIRLPWDTDVRIEDRVIRGADTFNVIDAPAISTNAVDRVILAKLVPPA